MATWKIFVLGYFALGALLIITTRARHEVLGVMSAEERSQVPAWKTAVLYCITTPVALLFWPFLLPSWLRKKETTRDSWHKPRGQGGGGLKELSDGMDDNAELRNCKFAYKCDKKWDDLKKVPYGDKDIRFCEVCEQKVYRCRTNEHLNAAIKKNFCVAIRMVPQGQPIEHEELLGLPANPDDV